MSNTRNLADLLDSGGDIKSAALDNVTPTTSASDLTSGTLAAARIANNTIDSAHITAGAVDDAHISGLAATKLTGTIAAARLDTATTQSASNNSTKIATTAYTDAQIATVVDSAPGTLNTLNELAAALGDDASFSTTVTNSIAAKLPLAGGTMTGTIAGFTSTGIDDNADATAITIDSSENIGLGTTPPSATSNSSYKQLFINTGGALVDSGGGGPATMVLNNSYIGSGNNNYATATQKAARIVMTSGRLTFDTAPSVSANAQQTFAERMRITDAGRVGIGTSSPAGSLEIKGGNASEHLVLSHSSGSSYTSIGQDSSDNLRIYSGTNERMRINSSGNVGIGVVPESHNSSHDALQVGGNGNWTVYGTQGAGGEMDLQHNAYYAPDGNDKYISTDEATKYRQGGGKHQWYRAASGSGNVSWINVMTIGNDGRVAINQTGNATAMQVSTSVAAETTAIFQGGGTGSVNVIDVRDSGGNSKFKIRQNGKVNIGGTDIVAHLNVERKDAGAVLGVWNSHSDGVLVQFFSPAGSNRGSISLSGSTTTYATSSDYRLKENVDYTWDATTRLKQLKPARFNFIEDDTNTLVDGFIAHEVSSVVPEAITGEKDAMTAEVLYVEGDELPEGKSVGDVKTAAAIDPQGIDQSKLVPLLVKTIQELEARITALEA